MRTAYRDQLDAFAHDLIVMCDLVREVLDFASDALIRGSLESAEAALTLTDDLEEIRRRCEQRAVELLLLQNPVAKELRQVISSIYIVSDFQRMGALGMHIANTARRRHPTIVVPDSIAALVEQLAEEVGDMAAKTREVLVTPNAEVAYSLAEADDHIDELNHEILTTVTSPQWEDSTREAVDSALLARYYERYADHCVAVAARIIYLITGEAPEAHGDALRNHDADTELLRRLNRLQNPR